MNRKERRAEKAISRHEVKNYPDKFTRVPEAEWPAISPKPEAIFMNKKFMVQLYKEHTAHYPFLARLTVNRVTRNGQGRWDDNITWDELQDIKRQLGCGEWYGVEVYPRDSDLVDDANMRHLWLMPTPLQIGWFSRK